MELLVEDLHAGYPGHRAVSGVDLAVAAGSVVAIVGPNGCGKSTLLRSIARLHKPDSGRVTVGGDDIWRLKPRQAAHRVGLLPQNPTAPEAVTVAGLVRYGRHPHQGLFRQWSRADERVCRDALTATGVLDLADRRVDRLSGGQRQRCWVAMVIAQEAPVMLLDEPTSALDLGHAVEVLGLVRQVAAGGRTVVMVLHDLPSAARYADVLVAMRDGRVVASGPPREVVDAALVRALYDVDADILRAPGDGTPVVVPRMAGAGAGAGAGVDAEVEVVSVADVERAGIAPSGG
ncbi:ABC transporter ATP-binding protein [Embleya sp. NBC_00888]|uniref:ABC transporter ATP-binding protein n=1 Tax=Embleya sp. NBC_00888 TaxID=2975960 RepID=UPI00386ECD21|nr:ABC transporter ATP-binding protein [Embleya sp. NBC_00888]